MAQSDRTPERSPRRFATTRWSLVREAAREEPPCARRALAELCAIYWYPVYVYIRRRGSRPDEAEDLTQAFFARLLEGEDLLQAADPGRGRFRCFLVAALEHFLANHWRAGRAQKRGGGKPVFSLDLPDGERRYAREPWHELTPQRALDRRWALTLLEQALGRLRQEYAKAGKLSLYDYLKPDLGGAPEGGLEVSYHTVAVALGMTEGAVKVAAHRLRRRCRERIRAEIAETVASPDELEDELRHLFTALAPEKCPGDV
jgi:RNA polymerase sigma-70 factor (ECF subfamily)